MTKRSPCWVATPIKTLSSVKAPHELISTTQSEPEFTYPRIPPNQLRLVKTHKIKASAQHRGKQAVFASYE